MLAPSILPPVIIGMTCACTQTDRTDHRIPYPVPLLRELPYSDVPIDAPGILSLPQHARWNALATFRLVPAESGTEQTLLIDTRPADHEYENTRAIFYLPHAPVFDHYIPSRLTGMSTARYSIGDLVYVRTIVSARISQLEHDSCVLEFLLGDGSCYAHEVAVECDAKAHRTLVYAGHCHVECYQFAAELNGNALRTLAQDARFATAVCREFRALLLSHSRLDDGEPLPPPSQPVRR